jgi:Ras-related protein Rab-21
MKFKVVLLGEGRVGKTSILIRFCKNTFNDRQQPTLQASYLDRKVTIEGQSVSLSVWDTAGQERFHALGPIYYRDADAALCVYDITDGDSLDRVKKWVQELKNHASDKIVIAIAGNKIDLEKRRHVSKENALALAKSVGAEHFDTSAKLNKGLQEAFLHLAKGLITTQKNDGGLGGGLDTTGTGRGRGGRNRQSRTIRIREDSEDMTEGEGGAGGRKKGGCC